MTIAKAGQVSLIFLVVILMAGGLTYAIKVGFVPGQEVTGGWQLDTLEYFADSAEEHLFRIETGVLQAFNDHLDAISLGGGATVCGTHAGVAVWNSLAAWCGPTVTLDGLSERITTATGREFSNVQLIDVWLVGEGEEETIQSPRGKYTYDTDFGVHVASSLEELYTVEEKAQEFESCVGVQERKACLDPLMPALWTYGKCGENLQEINHLQYITFCAEEWQRQYQFVLQFT